MATPGPWRDDLPDQETGEGATDLDGWEHTYIEYAGSPDPGLLTEAIANGGAGTPFVQPLFQDPTGTPHPPFSTATAGSMWTTILGVSQHQDVPGYEYQGVYVWRMDWKALDLPAPPTGADVEAELGLNEYDLPADVFDTDTGRFVNPNVVGFQWGDPYLIGEPKLNVTFFHSSAASTRSSWYLVTRPVAPGEPSEFLSHAQLRALSRQPVGITPDTPDGFVETGTAPFNVWADGRFQVGLLDAYIYDTAYPANENAEATALFVTVAQGFRAPYRLLYAGVAPPCHLYPRSAIENITVYPPASSRQRSNRTNGPY